jgi:hypothetical protein
VAAKGAGLAMANGRGAGRAVSMGGSLLRWELLMFIRNGQKGIAG